MKPEPEDQETIDALPRSRDYTPPPMLTSLAGGRYKVDRLLGEGGQKQVYLARDMRLGRDVVISLLKIDRLDEKSQARFWHEAQAMGRLSHPNIVTVHDVGEEDGRPYIVSQYVEGGSVADLLRAAGKHPLAIEQALRIGREVCRALEHAHANGIVHRDLKPGNVWLAQDGTAKLGDFGLAMGLHLSRITLEGMMLGTVAYMPPEQAMGRQAEPRSDLYSLGAMLYEMVAGRPPFLGDQLVGIIAQHMNTPPVAPSWHNPEIPQALEALILQLLAKLPEDRPESAVAVEKTLAAIATSAPALAERVVQQDTKSLARLAGGVFVGREKEMGQIRAALNDALSGRGRLLLLMGEPGSGKTRITEQLATYASLRGAHVLVGRCYEGEGAPAFWPWLQIVRAYVSETKPDRLISVMGAGAGAIAQIVSEVRERLPDLAPPTPLEPEQARFRLFDSVTTFLKNASRSRPLILVLDDLHWADRPSLLLLQFLARDLRDSRLLVLGTFRDVELGRHHPLAQTLGELARLGLGDRIALRGLLQSDVAHFIEMTAGVEPNPGLVAAVYRHSEGNPLFVNEIVRLLVSEGHMERPEEVTSLGIPIPQGVRDVIGRRLEHLSEPCSRILTLASVVGREFSVAILESLGELSGDQLLEALEEAVAARVINELPRALGHYTFSHALIRETLYDEVTANRRVRLHRRIGEALEKLYAAAPDSHLPELAHHFFQAAPGGDVDKAVGYSVRAAQRATNLLAYEEAAGHYERALEALALREPVDESRRCELLLGLGDSHRKAGSVAKGREIFEQSADLARKIGAPVLLARAALGIGAGITAAVGVVDQLQIKTLREALDALGEGDSVLRARLLAQLAMASYYLGDVRFSLSQQAVEMARRLGDPMTQIQALYSRHAVLVGPFDLEERFAVSTELLRISQEAGDKEMVLRAHYRRYLDLLEMGNMAAVDEEIAVYAGLASELRQPRYLWLTPFFRAARAVFEGRFADAERLGTEALAIGERAQDRTTMIFYGVLMNVVRVEQGRAEDLIPIIRSFMEKYPAVPGYRATLAYVLSQARREEEARSEFAKVTAAGMADLPRDGSWIPVLAMSAYTCHYLNDARSAEILYPLLLPFEGRNIVPGNSGVGAGSTSLALALFSKTMGRWDEAEKHFERAIVMNERMDARPFLARSLFPYSVMLEERGRPGDREKAHAMRERSLAIARELGMVALVEAAQGVGN